MKDLIDFLEYETKHKQGKAMKYYINTSKGLFVNSKGEAIAFDTTTSAREFVIAYCDLSDKKIEVLQLPVIEAR